MNIETAAPAEQPSVAEIGETTDTYTAPLGAQIPDKEPVVEEASVEPSKSPREAVERALKQAKEQTDDADKLKPEPKAEEKPNDLAKAKDTPEKLPAKAVDKPLEPVEAEKVEQPAQPKPTRYEAPPRFHEVAKQEWETVPESVRAEVHRGFSELENGLHKYRESAEKYEAVREYDELATKHGTTVKDALANYTGIERLLHENPVQGLEQIIANVAAHKGWRNPDGSPTTFRDIAAHYLNMPADQAASRQDGVIQQLNAKIAQLEQITGSITQNAEQQRLQETASLIEEFKRDHPRVDELTDDIALLIQTKRATKLKDAYDLAYRMNPSSRPLTQAAIPEAAHTRTERPANVAGQKSVTGAPSAGSDPETAGKPSSSIREALRKAARKAQ